jgi:translation elongation factor EF-Ts
MNIGTAAHIAQLATGWQMEAPKLLDAVAELRRETGLSIMDAKPYLTQFNHIESTAERHVALFEKLCADYVPNVNDLLQIKREQVRKLQEEIAELEASLGL